MKNPDHDPLWRDSLDEGIEDASAADSLAGMLAYARRRRRRRRTFGIAAAAGMLAALVCLALRPSHPPPPRPLTADRSPGSPTGTSENAGLAQVHFLTDDELLSRFPDRPVALIGPPGDRRLVFLDKLP